MIHINSKKVKSFIPTLLDAYHEKGFHMIPTNPETNFIALMSHNLWKLPIQKNNKQRANLYCFCFVNGYADRLFHIPA